MTCKCTTVGYVRDLSSSSYAACLLEPTKVALVKKVASVRNFYNLDSYVVFHVGQYSKN
jgi:hypothetical protein